MKISANGRINFLGWRSDIDTIMPLLDILVLPSLNEGMGRVLVEAMAAGKPIVASNVGGIPDLVQHNHNGLLVPPGDSDALAGMISTALANPSLRDRVGAAGRQRVIDHWSWRHTALKTVDQYHALLEETKGRY